MNPDVEKLVQLAMTDLAKTEGVTRSSCKLLSTAPKQFRDTSLGVREPGRMYAQVITSGYVITLQSNSHRYVYHGAGTRVVRAKG